MKPFKFLINISEHGMLQLQSSGRGDIISNEMYPIEIFDEKNSLKWTSRTNEEVYMKTYFIKTFQIDTLRQRWIRLE